MRLLKLENDLRSPLPFSNISLTRPKRKEDLASILHVLDVLTVRGKFPGLTKGGLARVYVRFDPFHSRYDFQSFWPGILIWNLPDMTAP